MEQKYLSVREVAEKMGISRQAVLKKIKTGEIPAQKVGRGYIVPERDIPNIMSEVVTESQKREINKSVNRTVEEYGEALKMLGKE
jgi:excisionase family DNA binding protein